MATYYVRSSGGSDSNDGLSFANAKATLSGSLSAMSNNDELRVCADGTHSPSAELGVSSLTGITITGANGSDGSDDGTIATISGSGMSAGSDVFQFDTAIGTRATFRNLRITAAKQFGINITGGSQSVIIYNCRIDTCTNDGCRLDNSSSGIYANLTEFDNNGSRGVGQSTTNRGALIANGCSFHDNASSGVNLGAGITVKHCVFYDNGASGIVGDTSTIQSYNCTFFRNTGSGISASVTVIGSNNIFANNTQYGVNHNSTQRTFKHLWANNLYYSNTSGNIDINSGALTATDLNPITGVDPQFVSTTNNSENLGLVGASPAKATGFPAALKSGGTNYLDVGAIQRQEQAIPAPTVSSVGSTVPTSIAYNGSLYIVSPQGADNTKTNLALDSAFVAGSAGDASASQFVSTKTGEISDIWVNVTSYTGTWASTDTNIQVLICPATSTTGLPNISSPVANGTISITLNGSTTGWIKKTISGSRPSVTAGEAYWIVICDSDGSVSNYVTMAIAIRDPALLGYTTYTSTSGFSAAGGGVSAGPPGCFALKIDGTMFGGSIFTGTTTTNSDTLMRGNRHVFPYNVWFFGVQTLTDVTNNSLEWRVYKSNQVPSDTPYGTVSAASVTAFNQTGLGTRVFTPIFLAANVPHYIVVKKVAASTTPRTKSIDSGLDADLKKLFPLNGECYAVAQHASLDQWVTDDTTVYHINTYFAPAGNPSAILF